MNRLRWVWGFTLLELIMTMVLFALVASMAVSYYSGGMSRTDVPVDQLAVDAKLQLVLENMIADWSNSPISQNLSLLSANIGSAGSTQSSYGSGNTYYIVDNKFVCPNASNVFVDSAVNQFLLVTIKSNATTPLSLSYLFSSTAGNCSAGGS